MIFFTSDHHFGHENIIKFTNRPFNSLQEMDEEMIKRWNSKVGPDDTVYHLGDFTLGGEADAREYFSALNGSINILAMYWHHDRRWLDGEIQRTKNGHTVIELSPMEILEASQYRRGDYLQIIVMCHYPLAEWDRKHYGAWHIHGHSHGKHKAKGLALDTGVDCHDFYPVSLDEIAAIMQKKEKEENV